SVAAEYSDVEVLAFDLSKASLAYGIRQARRYGIKNLEFVHGDILCVDKLGERFDVIEAGGVLHHMQEPAAGLRALAAVLNPRGFFRIGLYSRRARHRILASARHSVAG